MELLSRVGLSQYERLTLIGILSAGVTDASRLCADGDIPDSKVYLATEKLERLSLISIQRSRPKLFAALSSETVIARLSELARKNADEFATKVRSDLAKLLEEHGEGVKPRPGLADVVLGSNLHVKRHLALLATAQKEIVSYMEEPDLRVIRKATRADFNVLRRIRKSLDASGATHRIVFGFNHRDAPSLLAFLQDFRQELKLATGVRYSGVLGHPFHVIDGRMIILSLDHPLVADRRIASFMLEDPEMAGKLMDGFQALWDKAMKSLTEIHVHPGARM